MRRLAAVVVMLSSVAVPRAQQRAPEVDSIRKEEMKADLSFLASDSMRGRLTDTPENRIAAEWIALRFERLGLVPAGDGGSYYQPFTLLTAAMGDGNRVTFRGSSGAPPTEAKVGEDFHPLRFSPSASASGEVVFVGFGISSPERGYDDYGADVKGKIVLAIDHEPGEADPNSPFDGIVTSQVSDQLWKTLAAQAKGASGILFVTDVHNHAAQAGSTLSGNYWPARPPRIPRYMLGTWADRVRIPAVQVSPAFASLLVQDSQRALADLSKASESSAGTRPVPLGVSVDLATSVERTVIPDRNVVALLEGSDPALRDEVVIVCAHYDHDGVNGDNVMNGADDDGSGTVGVMEIAEAFALGARKGGR
ncbi:MAG TPA: M28 family peptidase, partial [Vicinamibacterales bacterium]|nr:M28 family peptidase [Vicinamibacterales bacterium]